MKYTCRIVLNIHLNYIMVVFFISSILKFSRERRFLRMVLVMVKFRNLMEQDTTKIWLKRLKETLFQGI